MHTHSIPLLLVFAPRHILVDALFLIFDANEFIASLEFLRCAGGGSHLLLLFFPILFLLLLTERLTIFCSCRTLGVRSHSLFHIAFFSISWNPTTANCHDAHNYELFYENLLPAMAAQKCSRNAETFWNFNTQHTFSTFRIFFLLHWLDFSKVVNASRTSSVWTNWRQFIDAFCCTLNPSEVDSVAAGQLSQVWRAYAWIEWQFEINT